MIANDTTVSLLFDILCYESYHKIFNVLSHYKYQTNTWVIFLGLFIDYFFFILRYYGNHFIQSRYLISIKTPKSF